MLSGMGKANWGRFFWVILSLMVCDSWGFDAFGQNSGARAVPDSNHPSLINEDSDKVDYFLRKKLNTRSLRFTEWREEVRFASSADSKVINATDSGDKIQVYIEVDSVDSDVKSILESYGATVEIINKNLKTIQAWIPESQVYQIAQLPFVKRMRNPAYAVFRNSSNSPAQRSLRSGSVTTEGDAILNADEVRARGVSGTGAKVGVITDGVTNRGTAAASGDLPLNITILAETAMGGDEGTALLEIVYDIAPGAELAFCGVLTSLDMIKCVNDLANVFAADIIVDDAAFFNEPYFEDGPVAQAVKNILPNRVYVAAAGNESKQHYTANFQGTNTLGITRNGLPANEHNFGLASGGGSSDPTLDVTLEPGESLSVFLQWNDPFGESSNDYDLYVYNASNEIIGRSEAIQDGDDDPFEELKGWINNTGSRQTYKIAVTKFSGEDKQIKLFIWAPAVLSEYAVSAGSIFGHPAVSGVLATAAIHADDPGNDTISDTCSQGPVEIFFPSRETRQKPDVTAIDCVSITGAGGFPVPFCGTSAAAPHVAGVAALLVGGSASPDEVSQVIMSTAVDLGSAGFDNIFGYGRVDAFSAAQELNLLSSSPQAEPPQPENDNGKGSGTCFISTVW